MENIVSSWNAYLSFKGFFIIIYWKILSVDVHLHVGVFDKMLMVGKYGVRVVWGKKESNEMKCEKCGLEYGYPFSCCPECGTAGGVLYEARPSKQELLDVLNSLRKKGLSERAYKEAIKALEELYVKEDKKR